MSITPKTEISINNQAHAKKQTLSRIEVFCIISDLLCPIVNELITTYPKINLALDSTVDLYARGDYYRIYNKDKLVIGWFSCKLCKSVKVYYASAKGNTFDKNKEFSCLLELIKLINKKNEQ